VELTTNRKGQMAEIKALNRAAELGYLPSKPIFNARYDMILEDQNGKLTKVQVKYADGKLHDSEGSVMVKLGYENRKKEMFTYQGNEVDVLVVYIPKINKLCLIPQNLFLGKVKIYIRYAEPKNGQKKGIVYARDYYW
jgi:hypothetical protein